MVLHELLDSVYRRIELVLKLIKSYRIPFLEQTFQKHALAYDAVIILTQLCNLICFLGLFLLFADRNFNLSYLQITSVSKAKKSAYDVGSRYRPLGQISDFRRAQLLGG